MQAIVIPGATGILSAPKDWDEKTQGKCFDLYVKAELLEDNKTVICKSAWQPTNEELQLLIAGAYIVLEVVGGQPPVMLKVEE